MRILAAVSLFSIYFSAFGGTANLDTGFQFSFYNDVYLKSNLGYNSNNITNPFLFNHTTTNAFSINQTLLRVKFVNEKVRGNLGFQAGTYPNKNYVADSNFRLLFEANAGFSLDKKNKLWFDAGIMPSYLGFEEAISANNLTISRSIAAENSPYYMTGLFLNYQFGKHWNAMVNVNNGWQKITMKSYDNFGFGGQITYQKDSLTLNYSNFLSRIGVAPSFIMQPGFSSSDRFFNNFYLKQERKKSSGIIGFDIGSQSSGIFNFSNANVWYAANAVYQYKIHPKFNIAARAEWYKDIEGVIVKESLNSFGGSFNIDFKPNKYALIRLEPRLLFVESSQMHMSELYFASIPSIMFSFVIAIR